MNFGIPIDNDYLRTLPEYKDRPDDKIFAKDRSKVALTQSNVYKQDALKQLDLWKSEYGNGVSTLCLFYNATGDTITVDKSHSWRGYYYKASPTNTVENGQWTTFIHVHPTSQAVGSAGAVIYHAKPGDCDFFVGWQNPWNTAYDPTCLIQIRGRNHWWSNGSASYMLYLLDDKSGPRSSDNYGNYQGNSSIGASTTSNYEAILQWKQ